MPVLQSDGAQENREFYGLLGLEEVMNLGWIMTLASPSAPAAQVSFMASDKTAPVTPDTIAAAGSTTEAAAPHTPRESFPPTRGCSAQGAEDRFHQGPVALSTLSGTAHRRRGGGEG